MSINDSITKPPASFAELVGRTIMDALTTVTPGQLVNEDLLGLLFLNHMGRAGLRLVAITNDNIGPEDITVELPTIDLPLAVRMRQAMDLGTTLELERTEELPMLLRRQAE